MGVLESGYESLDEPAFTNTILSGNYHYIAEAIYFEATHWPDILCRNLLDPHAVPPMALNFQPFYDRCGVVAFHSSLERLLCGVRLRGCSWPLSDCRKLTDSVEKLALNLARDSGCAGFAIQFASVGSEADLAARLTRSSMPPLQRLASTTWPFFADFGPSQPVGTRPAHR